jgi:hypothetical protein
MKPTRVASLKPGLLGAVALCVISLFLPPALPAAQHLFTTQVPTGAFQDYPNGELGTEFQSDTPGQITALRYYAQSGDNDETTLTLWDAATQTALASVTGTPSGTAGWFELSLPTPVNIAAGSNYVVSYNGGANGNYAVTAHLFDVPLVSGHLTAPISAGVFADSGFPATVFDNTCYFADVALQTVLGSPDMVVEGNGLTIATGDTSPSTADGTQFGGVKLGSLQSRTFTITNSGTADLVLSGAPAVALAGLQSADFTVTTQPAASVLPGGATTFSIQFAPSAAGLRDATVIITNNAGTPYRFAIEGIALGSGYRLLGNRTSTTILNLAGGQIAGSRFMALRNMRLAQMNVQVASLAATAGDAVLKCALYSDSGGAPAQLLSGTSELVNPTNGWYSLPLAQAVDVGVASNYWLVVWANADQVALYADSAGQLRWGTYAYDVTWPGQLDLSAGASGGTLCLYAEGLPTDDTGPEMEVQGDGFWIPAGSTNVTSANGSDLGGKTLGGGTRVQTFAILNVGSASLALTGAPSVTVVGPDASDFVVTAQPAASVPAGGSTTLTTTFTPSAVGLRRATVTIPHADSPANAYSFAIQGEGLDPGAGVLGNDGIGTDTRFIDRTDIQANRFMAPGDLRITELHAKVVEGAATFVCAVYSDNNGFADRMLASSVPVANATNGWNTFPLTTPLNVTGGNYYWLAIWSDTPAAVLQEDGGAGRYYYGIYSYADLGGQWPDPIDLVPALGEARTYCIYAEGTPLVQAPGAVISLRGNGKLIVSGDNSPSGLDGTDFGSLAVGTGTLDRTFRIENSGLAPLQLTNDPAVIVTGPQAGDFRVTSPPTSPVSPGGSTTFTVRFAPAAGGFRAATISIANNGVDPAKNPYQFAIQGAGQVPGRESLWPDSKVGADVNDDGTYYQLGTIFQSSVPGAVTQLRVFSVNGDYGNHTAYIWRTSDQAVMGGPYAWDFGHVTGWVYFDIPPVNLDPATDYTVSVSTGTGPHRDYANVAADVPVAGNNGLHLSYPVDAGVFNENSADTMPFKSWNHSTYLRDVVFVPAGTTATFPSLAVQGNNLLIPDGFSSPAVTNHTDFGPAAMGGGAVERTFLIANTGTAPLNLSATPKVAITGPQAGDFTVLAQPATPVPPGGNSPFTIRFSPLATGLRSALVTIENNDKNPFYFSIAGTGTVAQVKPRIVSIAPNLTTGDVTLGWQDGGPQFQVEKTTTITGQFQPVGPMQTERTFTDSGVLRTNAQTFYRVRQL